MSHGSGCRGLPNGWLAALRHTLRKDEFARTFGRLLPQLLTLVTDEAGDGRLARTRGPLRDQQRRVRSLLTTTIPRHLFSCIRQLASHGASRF